MERGRQRMYNVWDTRTALPRARLVSIAAEVVADFWARLALFASLGIAPRPWPSVPPGHPFLCCVSDRVVWNGPPDVASPPDRPCREGGLCPCFSRPLAALAGRRGRGVSPCLAVCAPVTNSAPLAPVFWLCCVSHPLRGLQPGGLWAPVALRAWRWRFPVLLLWHGSLRRARHAPGVGCTVCLRLYGERPT